MKNSKSILPILFLLLSISMLCVNCKDKAPDNQAKMDKPTEKATTYPSDVFPYYDKWVIKLGDGESSKDLVGYEKKDYFYTVNEDGKNWVVYKTPNSGITTKNSSNTRTELGEKRRWKPKEGGRLTGTLKVQHVSTTGDARVAASYAVVVGQIHSDEGHKNEPLKIFYKKFPGHTKGSVYWNYEINTQDSNDGRWDFSTSVWGHDMSVIGDAPDSYPDEPKDGIALGEEFSYEVIVTDGIMKLNFTSPNHEAKTFTKNLIKSEYIKSSDIPQQILTLYASIDRDGTEQPTAYAGEDQFFKQGAYNQTNGKKPETNMVWSTGSEVYGGDIAKQYANGSYAEVWFSKATVE